MSGDLKQYEATPRRLEKLRQAGQTPSSAAIAGVSSLAVATLVMVVAGRPLSRGLAGLLAEGMRAAAGQQALAPLLARHLLVGGAAVILFAAVLAVTVLAARGLQTGGAMKSPWAGWRAMQTQDWPSAALAAAGVSGLAAIFGALLERYREAGQWRQLIEPQVLLALWLRALCLLAGLAVLHFLWMRAAHLQRAMLTHRELQDERQEVEGSWLKDRLRKRRPTRD